VGSCNTPKILQRAMSAANCIDPALLSHRKSNSIPQITQKRADESGFILIRLFCGHPRHLR
jgi:hypothetical protein